MSKNVNPNDKFVLMSSAAIIAIGVHHIVEAVVMGRAHHQLEYIVLCISTAMLAMFSTIAFSLTDRRLAKASLTTTAFMTIGWTVGLILSTFELNEIVEAFHIIGLAIISIFFQYFGVQTPVPSTIKV